MKLNVITQLILIGVIFIATNCLGQSDPGLTTHQVIPATPTVAAMQKYVNFPVKLSTGVPEISIPVYTINVKGLSYPIALSYHASGIKMADIASEIGLGWSLSAGGMINEQANGLLDDFYGSYVTNPEILSRSLISGYGE